MRKMRNISGWAVMKTKCPSCPFGEQGDAVTANSVASRVLTLNHSQICHHPVLHGRKEKQLCRGARDLQLKLLHILNLITAPTDKAFKEASERALNSQEKSK
jgi:hypothetical protein